jgi:hypothetical protein
MLGGAGLGLAGPGLARLPAGASPLNPKGRLAGDGSFWLPEAHALISWYQGRVLGSVTFGYCSLSLRWIVMTTHTTSAHSGASSASGACFSYEQFKIKCVERSSI